MATPISLKTLAALIPDAVITGPPAMITGVTHDSRRVRPGDLFVALPGEKAHGITFAAQALQQGAAAVAVGPEITLPSLTVPVITLSAPRRQMGLLAAAVLGHPSRQMHMVGITGTNGKTTVTRIMGAMCEVAGITAGLVGTVGHTLITPNGPTALTANDHTTPESPDLQQMLAEMVDGGAALCAMEVSSVGLTEHRLEAVDFNVAAFLNLTPDHLDYHGTMAAYGDAKAQLFRDHMRVGGVAIINMADPFGSHLASQVERQHVTWRYGEGRRADVRYEALDLHADGISGNLETPAGPLLVESPLMGQFNAHNLAIAAASGLAIGLPVEAIEQGMSQAVVPGRMERVPHDLGFTVLVDYAHSPDALSRVIESVRSITEGYLWCIFGCGGDRDPGKRPLMGRAAADADGVVVTSDNPRSEDPRIIAEAAAMGAEDAGRSRAPRPQPGKTWVQLDRRQAIAGVLAVAQPGDTVIIAGKGHEAYQEISGVRHPFDDVQVAAEILASLTPDDGGGS
ncbi:MAG: UDP-N-acetylmuramoyl-L-alanyl-D-glutamate--2,6-diaminopimelate ligase [Bradymonadia bacterium]